jgi:hypothetical protein
MTQTPIPEQPTATAGWGFDIAITKGQSYTPSTGSDDDDSSNPLGGPVPPYWDRVQCDILDEAAELNGFRYSMRYWVSFEREGSVSYTYGQWQLISQTIEIIDPKPPLFTSNNGDELFPMLPGPGTNLNNKGGIKNGTKYDYLSVFDEADISWLPRASTIKQPFMDQRYVPQVDDTDNRLPDPQFSMDTVSAFVPDERLEIPVTYRVKTTFEAPEFTIIPAIYDPDNNTWSDPELDISEDNWVTRNHTFTIRQVCFQDLSDITKKLKKVLDASYFTHGYYHIQLYDLNAPPNYDDDANVIGPVIQPLYEKDEEKSEIVGFDVFRLINTVADESEIDLEEIEEIKEGIDDQIKGMLDQIKPLIDESQKQIDEDEANVEKAQKEYEEEIRLNAERQDKLINNMLRQMDFDVDHLNSGGESQYTFESLMEMLIERRSITSGDQDEE